MEKLISTRSPMQSVPASYILPPESRPGPAIVPVCESIPVIDLEGELASDREKIIQQIINASQEFGFFQLVNHGISEKLMQDVLEVAEEFYELPAEEKAKYYSEDPKQSCKLYTSLDFANEKVHFWRDNFRHPCHPLEEHVKSWPENPSRYREVIGKYSVEVRKLSLWILDLICEGLELGGGYFENGSSLTKLQMMAINHYPPCPDPSLTLGLPKHSDVNLITILLQGQVHGLQVYKDGQWLAVEPHTNAFMVNIGHMLQVISNGKLKSGDHRVVTSRNVARTTVGSFIHPSTDCHIEPAKVLVDKKNSPPLYRAFAYIDFFNTYISDTHSGLPPLQRYEL